MRPILVLLALLALGCDERTPVSPSSLQSQTWRLESIERVGSPAITIPTPGAYTVVFEADGRLSVRADCNSCGGRYSLNGSTLSTSGVACTRVFCGNNIDTTFASSLGEATSLSLEGSVLLLRGPGLTLRFRS